MISRQTKRIPRKRRKPRVVHSERTEHITGHRRVRLYGKEREARRAEIFARAGGRCEEIKMLSDLPGINVRYYVCGNPATEWSHARHGANKCDCLDPRCSIASCTDCHKKRHAGGNGKPCPKKAGINPGGQNGHTN